MCTGSVPILDYLFVTYWFDNVLLTGTIVFGFYFINDKLQECNDAREGNGVVLIAKTSSNFFLHNTFYYYGFGQSLKVIYLQ